MGHKAFLVRGLQIGLVIWLISLSHGGGEFVRRGPALQKSTRQGTAGALVSDGVISLSTARDRSYELLAKESTLVIFLVLPGSYAFDPDGFWNQVSFKEKQQARVDFKLSRKKRAIKFIFLRLTDVHWMKRWYLPEMVAHAIRELTPIKPTPDFVIRTGDMLLDVSALTDISVCPKRYRGFIEVFRDLRVPHLRVIGNHDCAVSMVPSSPELHKETYRTLLGPVNDSFDYGKIYLCPP